MKTHLRIKPLAAVAAGCSLAIAGCNSGSTASGQNQNGTPTGAQTTASLFAANSCLSGKFNFSGSSQWYISGGIDIINQCNSDQSLSGQTISLTSQDSAAKPIALGTLNNWWINDSAYQLIFTSGNANQQIATITASNNNPIIKANQTITFSGGLNLNGNSYDTTSAQNSFSINGASPTPPATTASLNIIVDTTNTNCIGTTSCNGLSINLSDATGKSVSSFTVPAASLGGTFNQQITKLTDGASYTVSGSGISNTTVSYTPAATTKVSAKQTASVTLKYDKTAPVITTGKAILSLANKVPNFGANLQVQLLNSANNSIVNTYTIKQGGSVTTEDLPVSDKTHAYVVKMTSGIADPLQGLYYLESGTPSLVISNGQTTSLAIPMVASTKTQSTLTVAISGLQGGDSAAIGFSDAANTYSYVNSSGKINGNSVYKIENGLNLGTSVQASSTNYKTNPLNTTLVINNAQTINAAFNPNTPPLSNATYDYTAGFQGGPGALITLNNTTGISNPKTAVVTSNFNPSVAGNCFTSSWGNINVATTQLGSSYQTTITAKDSTDWSGKVTPGYLNLATSCGLSGGASVLAGVQYGIVSSLSINGNKLRIIQPCSGNSCSDPGNGKVISGYYPDWARYGKKFPLSKVPFANLNEVLYAFIGFDQSTGNIKSLDAWADQNEMPTLSKAMLQYPYLHGTLSFGGWTNAGVTTAPMFDALTKSDSSIANFTSQAVATMRAAGYDGIDIDWEWWSDYSQAPTAQQLKLYSALRSALDTASKADAKKYRLTIAVSAGVDKIQATEAALPGAWSKIAALVDNINVMAYDMHGGWDTLSDVQAPWGMEATSPYKATNYAIKLALQSYQSYGVSAAKLVVGIPAYGRAVKVASLSNYGLYQTITGVPGGDNDDSQSGATGVFLYNCIINSAACNNNASTITALNFINQGSATFNQLSSQAQQPWAYGSTPQGNIFLTYDNVPSATYKAQQIKSNGYAGAMIWEIDGDTVDNSATSLIVAIKNVFNGN